VLFGTSFGGQMIIRRGKPVGFTTINKMNASFQSVGISFLYLIFYPLSVVKQKQMVFGFRKTATAVTRPERQIFYPFKDEAQTALFKTPVRTAL
jgi:hypothetical protein